MVATCWKKGRAHHWQHQPKGSLASRMVGGCGSLDWANWAAVVFRAIWLWTQIIPVCCRAILTSRTCGIQGEQGRILMGSKASEQCLELTDLLPWFLQLGSFLFSIFLTLSYFLNDSPCACCSENLTLSSPNLCMGLMGFWTAACPWLSVSPLYLSPHDSGSFIFFEHTHTASSLHRTWVEV